MTIRKCFLLKMTLLVGVCGVCLTPAVCAGSQREAGTRDWVDRLVDVGGYRLHLRCRGEGSPVVLLDTGIGETYRTWDNVVSELSGETRVCVYDRAGYGESERGPFPRTARRVAGEMVSLTKNGDLGRRFVLVGHSLGGIHSIVFAAEHPELVAGIVVVDPPPIDFVTGKRFPNLGRMAENQTQSFRQLAAERRQSGDTTQAAFFETLASEHEMMFSKSAQQLGRVSDIGDIPFIVIGSTRANPAFEDSAATFQAFWIKSNQRLASLSDRGKFVLARDASHHVHLDAPEIILAAIREIVNAERKEDQAE
ncbi:MAG: alpha/beta hydrolase [Candidatus Latescibacterota bacterium]|nr:MAG: alpha/beta hydrolase [Candidatus Latescibacterota bacterium]